MITGISIPLFVKILLVLLFFLLFYLLVNSFPKVKLVYDMAGSYDFPDSLYIQLNLAASSGQVLFAGVPILIVLVVAVLAGLLVFEALRLHKKRLFQFNSKLKNGLAQMIKAGNTAAFWDRAMIVLLAGALFLLLYIQATGTERLPHVPDAVAYLFQAKTFAEGRLFTEAPSNPESFPVPGIINFQGKMFSQYNFGHPLILSIGYIINAPWLIPPVIAICSLLLMYQLGKYLFSAKSGFFAALVLFLSPFFQMNAVDFMSHNTAVFFTLLFTFSFLKLLHTRRPLFSLSAGFSLGMLLNTRPYTAFLVALPFIVLALHDLVKNRRQVKKILQSYLEFTAVFLVFILALLLYNKALTGNALHMPYSLGYLESFGFSAVRPLSYGLMDIYVNLSILDKVVFGVAGGFSFIFILFWLVKGKKNKYNLLFFGIIIAIVLGHLLYQGAWMMYGPRFWLEIPPFFILLTIAGIKGLIHVPADIFPRTDRNYLRQFTAVVIPAFFACVLLTGTLNWLSPVEKEGFYPEFTPHTVGELKGFNFANSSLVKKVAGLKISSAVVFIKKQQNWWSYGIPSYSADFSLEGDIVYAVDLGEEKNKKIMEMYPERNYYLGDYDTAEISSYNINE